MEVQLLNSGNGVAIKKFKLTDTFILKYKDVKAPFGYNGLGEFTFYRTYSRVKDDGTNEQWYETIRRVVEGTYTLQKIWIEANGLGWNAMQAQKSAQEMYDRMFNMKFLPPGRGLWAMGTDIVYKKGLFEALNNCSYISTLDIKDNPTLPFCFLMNMSMLGVGVGFDTGGEGKLLIKGTDTDRDTYIYTIPDTREGWVQSLKLLMESYIYGTNPVMFNYDELRLKGEPIKTFGGVSSGYEPLYQLHEEVRIVLESIRGEYMMGRHIIDIMNLIGRCVVSGNVRRSSEIVFGDINDTDYLELKDYTKNPDRAAFGWASNNSVFAKIGDDYTDASERTKVNGEPGYAWLKNMQDYGRMIDPPNYKDWRVMGGNACLEQSLESKELCVSGNTKVQTDTGVYTIKSLVGKSVNVWNGKKWSMVTPFQTLQSASTIRVTITDGSYLDCTKYHKFSARKKTQRNYREIKACDLKAGDHLPRFSLCCDGIVGNKFEYAYEAGFFKGDGYLSEGKPVICLCGKKVNIDMSGKRYPLQHPIGYKDPIQRISLNSLKNNDLFIELKQPGLPLWVFELDKTSIIEFISGYIDSDGTTSDTSYSIYGDEQSLRDLQLLLRRINVDETGLSKVASKGDMTNKGCRSRDLFVLRIPGYYSYVFNTRLKKVNTIIDGYITNNAHPNGKKIYRRAHQKVKSIEYLNINEPVYCFTENETHMGVFGNVITHQCNLVETFIDKHDSLEDYLRTLKFAYLYAKTITLGKTAWPETNRIILRNRRIGCSISGIVQFLQSRGIDTLREWTDKGYQTIQHWDEIYSSWLAILRSIKTTSVKPLGTVALLVGATPGVHYPISRFYIRRVRLADNSPLLEPLKKAGYYIEDDVVDKHSKVVEFYIDAGEGVDTLQSVSMYDQLNLTAFMQKYWADNQVSSTITFKAHESPYIKKALEMYQYQLKGISFLPDSTGIYSQMLYESIDEKIYMEKVKNLEPIDFSSVKENVADMERFCSGDTCEIASEISNKKNIG